MKYLPLIVVALIVLSFSLAVPLASAAQFDNVKGNLKFGDGISSYGKVEIRNWFGLGRLAELELKKNTDYCGLECSATKEITLYSSGVLVDDIRFYKASGFGGADRLSDIDSYNFYIIEKGTSKRIPYTIGDSVDAGTYELLLEGTKGRTETYDWQIKSQGIWIDEWALWAGQGVYENAHGVAAEGSSGPSDRSGLQFIMKRDDIIKDVRKYAASTATKCYLYNSSYHVIASGDFVGVNCSLNYTVDSGKTYYAMVDNDGSAYTRIDTANTAGAGMPYEADALNFTSSCYGWVGETRNFDGSEIYDVQSIYTGAGNGSVVLNSPVDNYTSLNYTLTFNCTATSGGEVSLANISFWHNETGTMSLNQTVQFFYGDSEQNIIAPAVGKATVAATWYGQTFNITKGNHSLEKVGVNLLRYDDPEHSSNNFYVEIYSTDSNGFPTGSALANTSVISTSTLNESYVWYNYTISSYNFVNGTKYCIVVKCPTCDASHRLSWADGGENNYSFGWQVVNSGETWGDEGLNDDFLFALYGVETNTTNNAFNLTFNGGADWFCSATDIEGDTGFSLTNRSFSIDAVAPTINITYPYGVIDYGYTNKSTYLNWTVTDTNLDSCWYSYDSATNTSLTCGSYNTTFNFSNQQNISFFANDSAGNVASLTSSWTYKIFENLESYNSSSAETAREGFKINITSDGTQTVSANLSYNGTSYVGTKTGDNSEMVFNYNFGSLPEIATATATNHSFHWEIYYGSQNINTSANNQTVERSVLGLCNATLTQPYINFTFEDEESATAINATIDSSTWTYYLGDGTVNKTLLYSNTTDVESYGFCFSPTDKTVKGIINLQYSLTGYPQRRWESTTPLTNTTNNQVLHLLSSADGTYSVYQVQTIAGNRIAGVAVTAERQFNGVWAVVEQGETDDAGGITMWLNPDFDHRLTFIKTGYNTQTVTVRPSSSTYTVVMADTSGSDANYNSSLEGLLWKVDPGSQLLRPDTNYTFGFNVTANYSNLVSCKLELLDNNSLSLGTITGCNKYGGNISILLNTYSNRSIRAKVSVDIGDGYIVLDADAYWMILTTNISERGTIFSFFKYARELDVFGSDDGRREFSRIVAFFFFLMIILGVLSKSTGWDFSTDGGLIVFVAFVVIGASVAGFFRLSYTLDPPNPWMDKYLVAIITGLFAFGFMMNKWARSMT